MLEAFLNPPHIKDYADYFKTLLSVSGVLLGLAFTALLFVIQSGFASFKYSRRMFLELYVLFGRNLLITLSYLTLMPLGVLYLGSQEGFLSTVYYLFALYFTKSLLDLYKHDGYIHTLFSTKGVPAHYGRIRAYFRYIRNLGGLAVLFRLVYLFAFLGYPVVLSFRETGTYFLTTQALFYSTLILLTFSILQIVNFIPHFFRLSNEELESKIQSEDNVFDEEKSDVDYSKEKLVLKQYLARRGVKELDASEEVRFLDGTLFLNFLTDRDNHEAWFNVNIKVHNNNVFEVRDAVLRYAFNLFTLLRDSMVDINSFVLSFHIELGGERMTRNIFFRSTRRELDDVLTKVESPISAVMKIKNKVFDELFRDLGKGEAASRAV